LATVALALIGLFNVFGTYAAGVLGQRLPKRYILSAIYALRSVVIVAFLLAPLTPWSVYLFAATMGLLWLSTVPPTNAVVAQIFGVQYMSMLGGFVFFSHQIGSFLGVWLGGLTMDLYGQIGLVVLIGLAAKNGILIVEFANKKREMGMPSVKHVLEAAAQRLRPILMTSLATALGALPIALSLGDAATSRIPLGIVIVGGILFSLILTLFVIPSIYTYISGKHTAETAEPIS